MKTTALSLLAVLTLAHVSRAEDTASKSTFPILGATHTLRTSQELALDGTFKILAAGSSSGWCRVEYEATVGAEGSGGIKTEKQQFWLNFARVITAQEVSGTK